jgi:ribosomal subunit interface protein
VTRFYDPLRQIANLWSSFQLALAAWDRISDILGMPSEMADGTGATARLSGPVLEFKQVNFHYPNGKTVLHDVNLSLEAGKTYALVGPTGGGKTTTASLMARLYDPSEGSVVLHGTDIRSYTSADRAKRIGFILQEPFLFSGTVLDNIFYGNAEYDTASREEKMGALEKFGNIVHMDVEVGVTSHHHHKGEVFECKTVLEIDGRVISVSKEEEDLYKAIDKVKDHLKDELADLKRMREEQGV